MSYNRTIKKYTAKNAKTKKSRKIVKTGGALSLKNWRSWFKRSKKIEPQPLQPLQPVQSQLLSQQQPVQLQLQPSQPTIIKILQDINSKLFDDNGNVREKYGGTVRIKGYSSFKNDTDRDIYVMETIADDLIILILIKYINLCCFNYYIKFINSIKLTLKKEFNTNVDDYKNFNVDKMSIANVNNIIKKYKNLNLHQKALQAVKNFNTIFININTNCSQLKVDYNKNMIRALDKNFAYIGENWPFNYAKYSDIYIKKYLNNKNNIFNTYNFARKWIYYIPESESELENLKIYEIFKKILKHKFDKYQQVSPNRENIADVPNFNYMGTIENIYTQIDDFCYLISRNEIKGSNE